MDADKIPILAQDPKSLGTAGLHDNAPIKSSSKLTCL